jgi:hypothetical protein
MKTLLLAATLLTGCGIPAYRGSFGLVSTRPLEHHYVALSDVEVEGEACFGAVSIITGLPLPDNVVERSIADAISKHEGATALLNLTFIDKGYCIYTRGLPALEMQSAAREQNSPPHGRLLGSWQ